MLEEGFGLNQIARRQGIPRKHLIFLEYLLGRATHLVLRTGGLIDLITVGNVGFAVVIIAVARSAPVHAWSHEVPFVGNALSKAAR